MEKNKKRRPERQLHRPATVFARDLRQTRERLDHSVEETAVWISNHSGYPVSYSAVRNWEYGGAPSTRYIEALASYLGMDGSVELIIQLLDNIYTDDDDDDGEKG